MNTFVCRVCLICTGARLMHIKTPVTLSNIINGFRVIYDQDRPRSGGSPSAKNPNKVWGC